MSDDDKAYIDEMYHSCVELLSSFRKRKDVLEKVNEYFEHQKQIEATQVIAPDIIGDFICPVLGCNFEASNQTRLQTHIGYHKAKRIYQCNYEGCNYITPCASNFRVHHRKHTGDKPFSCPIKGCNFKASQSNNLKIHAQRPHTKLLNLNLKSGDKQQQYLRRNNRKITEFIPIIREEENVVTI